VSVVTAVYRPSPRGQWAAVIVTIVACVALVIGLPRLAEVTKPADTALTAGERVEAGGVSIVPGEGWVKVVASPLLTIDNGAAKLTIFTPEDDATTAADKVKADSTGFTTGTVGEVSTFTTDSGLNGAMVVVTDAESISVLVAFDDGERLASGFLATDPAAWDAVQAAVEPMLTTVEFTAETPS
jgi:hypothetical protein